MIHDELETDTPIIQQENFVIGVYALMDEAIASELERLRHEDGIVPSCKSGCCHCCRYHILTNIAEAQTIAQYIRREFSAAQLNDLHLRTQQWHAWDNARPGRHPFSKVDEQVGLSDYDHSCPLDVNGACSAYPVRPNVCRTHFVCSSPLSCETANDPESEEAPPSILRSVVRATHPFPEAMKTHIENTGLDFSRSLMLLPQWLAIEMGWDFTISQ